MTHTSEDAKQDHRTINTELCSSNESTEVLKTSLKGIVSNAMAETG